ncbi:MinD/ParA family ATP-binding protein [Halobacterium yunchengense]|uniref:MinD/ParA family ATP-binding protein n=1 Tax=Halobacterium yunchengense TaxID=3108497 RepID=UPI00300AFCF8
MLAVAGGKGGSGKTTTALGVAGALVQRRRRPLVADCDLDAPNLHVRAGVPRDPGVDAQNPVAAAHESPVVPGVDVLPAGDADGAALAATLDALPDDRPVLLDCPAGASEAAARPVRAADACVVVATRGRESVEDAVKTAELARAVGTPVRALAVSRSADAPRGLEDAAGAPTVPVPAVEDPLADRDAAAAYARVADCAGPNT